ncbi:MAG TPA: ABC transporter permease subunit [Verrucomicrobiae bacterium]|nr:ABC transporter permease subunit [Verrucomicrobiae bacterium]
MTEFAFAVRCQLRSGLVWAGSLAAYVALVVAAWPTVRHAAPALASYVRHLPRGLAAAFGVTSLATPAGYLEGELFAVIVPFLLITAAVLSTVGLTAGDEDQGYFEILLTLPVSRRRILLQRGLAALVVLVALGAVIELMVAGVGALVGLGIALDRLTAATLALVVLAALHAAVAHAGAGLGLGRTRALAVALSIAGIGYVMNSLLPLARGLAPVADLSPWHWTVGQNPLHTGVPTVGILGELALIAALVTVGTLGFGRRDIRAA